MSAGPTVNDGLDDYTGCFQLTVKDGWSCDGGPTCSCSAMQRQLRALYIATSELQRTRYARVQPACTCGYPYAADLIMLSCDVEPRNARAQDLDWP